MPNFSSLARLEVPEKFVCVWGGVRWVVCTVILLSNLTVVSCCVEVGVLTIGQLNISNKDQSLYFFLLFTFELFVPLFVYDRYCSGYYLLFCVTDSLINYCNTV